MMHVDLSRILLGSTLFLTVGMPAAAQTGASASGAAGAAIPAGQTDPCDQEISNTVLALKRDLSAIQQKPTAEQADRTALFADVEDWSNYVCELAPSALQPGFLADAERMRMDKQPGATSNASGSTSLVSKGSSPSLLGFALEHGGLTQTTSGSTITFRGNVANSVSALLNGTYVGSYDLAQQDPLVRYLSRLSFGVSFDTKANQPSTAQGFEPSNKNFSGFSAKYDVYNHRDPREASYRRDFAALVKKQGFQIAHSMLHLDELVRHSPHYKDWTGQVYAWLQQVRFGVSDPDLEKLVRDARNLFVKLFSDDPAIRQASIEAAAKVTDYNTAKTKLYNDIRKTPIVTVEYNLTRQLTSNDKTITATQPNQKIPDLSNVNLVVEGWFGGGPDVPELTLNVGGTWFNSPNTADPTRGRVRDIRASLEADWQLTALLKLNKPTVSLSGQYLNLIAEPLGQQVTLNGVTINRRGPMEIFQAKLTVPAGGSSGVKIPISFTWASRTELVKESDVRGNIGISFDFDTLFSKSK